MTTRKKRGEEEPAVLTFKREPELHTESGQENKSNSIMRGPHRSSIDWSIFFTSAEGGEKKDESLPPNNENGKEKKRPSQLNQTVAGWVFFNGDGRRWNMLQQKEKKNTARRRWSSFYSPLSTSLRGRACRLPGCTEVCGITPGCGFRLRCRRDVSLLDHRGLHTLHTSSKNLVPSRPPYSHLDHSIWKCAAHFGVKHNWLRPYEGRGVLYYFEVII